MIRRSARLIKKGIQYIKQFGLMGFFRQACRKTLVKLLHKLPEQNIPALNEPHILPVPINPGTENWYYERFPYQRPMQAFIVPATGTRINLITDSINASSLYGGVGTAIILCTLMAKRLGCPLRVITMRERAVAQNFFEILKSNQIAYSHNVEFLFDDPAAIFSQIDISPDDLLITTSWWTTQASLKVVSPRQIVYLLQEDETMFYPYGDEHFLCSRILAHPEIKFIINTELLFNHFVAQGLENIHKHGVWFEPSFSSYYADPPADHQHRKRRFFFYARPHNLRNLFYLGLKTIEAAVTTGVLNLDEWDLYFVGKDLATLNLPERLQPHLIEGLSWSEYGQFLRSIDIGLCLMYTPHPSYPPLDLAASGAIAVTNQFGLKQDLGKYSQNIICCPTHVEGLVQGIAAAIDLANHPAQRQANYRNNGLLKNWESSFSHVLETLEVMR
jgi:O-antigen biosynthesis protein